MLQTPLNRLAIFGGLAGALTGVLVAGLNWAAIFAERLVYGADHLTAADPTSHVTPVRLAFTLIVLGFVLSWAWYLLNRFGKEQISVPGAMGGQKMPVGETILSALFQVVSVASGAPVGRENAPRLVGGLAGSLLGRWARLDQESSKILIASCAGAGLGATFHLPLAGALFALELLLVEMSTRTVVISMLTSATAVAVTGIFVEPHPIYHSVPVNESGFHIAAAVVVGLVAGIFGHWFGVWARKAATAHTTGTAILWQMPLGFAIIAGISYALPGVSANARWTADSMFTESRPLQVLLLLFVVRIILILIAFRVGTVGGTLTPAFGLGAILGGSLGVMISPLFPGVPVEAFAILGAAAFLSTTMAAPMFGMIAAIEFTDMAAQGYLPVFISVVAAAMAVRMWGVLVHKDEKLLPFTSAMWTRR